MDFIRFSAAKSIAILFFLHFTDFLKQMFVADSFIMKSGFCKEGFDMLEADDSKRFLK